MRRLAASQKVQLRLGVWLISRQRAEEAHWITKKFIYAWRLVDSQKVHLRLEEGGAVKL